MGEAPVAKLAAFTLFRAPVRSRQSAPETRERLKRGARATTIDTDVALQGRSPDY